MINEQKDTNNPFLFNLEYVINNKVVATLKYTHLYDRLELEDITVDKDYLKKHIASQLMEYLINKAKQLKAVNITLEVNVNNIKAINLYKKYKFQQVAIRPNYYGHEDGLLMELKIGSD